MVFVPLMVVVSVPALPLRVLVAALDAAAFASTVSVPVAAMLALASSVIIVLGVSVRVIPLDVNEVAVPEYKVS